MAKNKEKAGAGRTIVILFVVLLLLLTVGAYGYGVYYFSSHFLPGSMVNALIVPIWLQKIPRTF